MKDTNGIVILLADDDEEDRMMASDALRAARLLNDLRMVGDGEEMLDYLHHRGKYASPGASPRPGLVLLDLNMPRMDGREALQQMKADPALRSIPVVILTTSRTEEDVASTYAMGANSFIMKPVSFDGLVQALQVVTEYWFRIVQLPNEA